MDFESEKKKKVRITAPHLDEQDMISRLSDDLIHIIMSFLDIKLAVQTCVLSKRWKLVWTTLPFLKFRSYYHRHRSPKSTYRDQITPKFVGKFLTRRNHQSQISSLKLMLLTPGIFARFLKYSISHRVHYLNVHLRNVPYNLSNFNSNSIQKLKVKIGFEDTVSESNCWNLPALTTLHVTRIHYDHTHNLPESCLTCLPALKTLCLTDWDLDNSSFSFSLPSLTTLRLINCKLSEEDWDFPALKTLELQDVVFRCSRKNIFAPLISLQNLTFFFHETSMRNWVLSCPRLVNLEIRTRYHHKNGTPTGSFTVSAPKLRNFTSVGIFSITFKKSKLQNVYVKLKGWIDHMILPREKVKEYYQHFIYMLSCFANTKILNLDSETIEALSSVTDYLVCSPSPFRKLKHVKLPLGCKEENICRILRNYLLGGSPTATIVTPWLQNNVIPNLAPAYVTAQNVVIQEPLATPANVFFDSENIHKTVCIETVDLGVKEQLVVQNSEGRQINAPVKGTDNDRVSSSKGNGDVGIWQGHKVNSEFVCLLNLIMNKYPETFEHYTTKNKKFCTMELNMLCTSINDFTKISMAKVDIEMIAEYRDVFVELQKYGFSVRRLESRLNYIEQLQFSHLPHPELRAIDCKIHDAKSKLQDLQIRVDDTKTNLQDLQTVRAEKMQEIRNVSGTMVANLAAGFIGDDLFCV